MPAIRNFISENFMITGGTRFLVTCEHGGNHIPAPYVEFFEGWDTILSSHRGYDPGALTLARELAKTLQAQLIASTVSRLLVELNRSPHHPHLFSQAVCRQPESLKQDILARYYIPYRSQAEEEVAQIKGHGQRIVHISSHSFTPNLNGTVRNADIGLLYDPSRKTELNLCRRWQQELMKQIPNIRVRRNYPYSGKSDGLCSYLRKRFSEKHYLGIELEVNQRYVAQGGEEWHRLRKGVISSLLEALP